MIAMKPDSVCMMTVFFAWFINDVKTNDSVIMDKPYKKSRRKIIR